jgi:hypothetical protein
MHDVDDGQSIAVGWPCGRATFGTTSWGRDVSAFAADAGTASALHIITDAIHALMNPGIRPPLVIRLKRSTPAVCHTVQ